MKRCPEKCRAEAQRYINALRLAWLALALMAGSALGAAAQNSPSTHVAGVTVAANYGTWRATIASGNNTTGTASITTNIVFVTLPDGRTLFPFNTKTPITIGSGGTQETVTPTAVSGCSTGSGTCTVTATFTYTHAAGEAIVSGDHGIEEAILDTPSGGLVVVDPSSSVTVANITGALNVAGTAVESVLSGEPIIYLPSGTTYTQAPNVVAAPVLSTGSITPAAISSAVLSGSFTGAATSATIGVATQTVTVTGAASGDNIQLVSAPAPTALCPLTTYRATAANTISLDFAVMTAAACTPATGTYKFLDLTLNSGVGGVGSQAFTLTGALLGDQLIPVIVPAPNAVCPLVSARATAANTVTLDFASYTSNSCTPTSGTYKFVAVR